MLPRVRSVFILLPILALVAGIALLIYARWSAPLVQAAAALDAGDTERALEAYGASAARFERFAPAKQVLPGDFSLTAHNQLALLYQRGEYDAVIEGAAVAPPDATPHFWVGCALFAKSAHEQKPEAQLEWLSRAEDEFKLALQFAPDDWDTKFNYELSARMAAAMRNQPKGRQAQPAPTSLMQLLRRQPSQPQQRPVKKTG